MGGTSGGTGSVGTGGGIRGGGGGMRKRRSSTGSGDGSGSGADAFTPGSDGNFAWNGTTPINGKPILVYVFDGHIYEGTNYDYSDKLENALFKDKEVVKESRDFICEKVCIGDHEILRKLKGREPVTEFFAKTMAKPEQRKVQLLFLDSTGQLIATFTDPKAIKEGVPALVKAMRAAKEENAKRLAANPVAPAKDAPAKDAAPKSDDAKPTTGTPAGG
ncbi:MAG: hypothetical protein FJ293_08625 [Planctomycetes bacterium]|nr:hypothetical protein [Planctomycetota bacterium]